MCKKVPYLFQETVFPLDSLQSLKQQICPRQKHCWMTVWCGRSKHWCWPAGCSSLLALQGTYTSMISRQSGCRVEAGIRKDEAREMESGINFAASVWVMDWRHSLVDGLDSVSHGEFIHYLLSRLLKVHLPGVIAFSVWNFHNAAILLLSGVLKQMLNRDREQWRPLLYNKITTASATVGSLRLTSCRHVYCTW